MVLAFLFSQIVGSDEEGYCGMGLSQDCCPGPISAIEAHIGIIKRQAPEPGTVAANVLSAQGAISSSRRWLQGARA